MKRSKLAEFPASFRLPVKTHKLLKKKVRKNKTTISELMRKFAEEYVSDNKSA